MNYKSHILSKKNPLQHSIRTSLSVTKIAILRDNSSRWQPQILDPSGLQVSLWSFVRLLRDSFAAGRADFQSPEIQRSGLASTFASGVHLPQANRIPKTLPFVSRISIPDGSQIESIRTHQRDSQPPTRLTKVNNPRCRVAYLRMTSYDYTYVCIC